MKTQYDTDVKAICLSSHNEICMRKIPFPVTPAPDHLIIKTCYCGINPGDLAFIDGHLPDCPKSMHDICGVSGSGKVIQTGKDVPEKYIGKNVAFYRSLSRSTKTIGTWSEYAHMHHTTCLILPDNADLPGYSGSLVNVITPYSFLKSIDYDGAQAIISTTGNSATGMALLGICLSKGYPLISIVRKSSSADKLMELGAKYVISQDNPGFDEELKTLAEKLDAKIVFDGARGSTLNRVIRCLPRGSSVYSYGFIGDGELVDSSPEELRSGDLTLKAFSVFSNKIVNNTNTLQECLNDLQEIIHLPHFKTNIHKVFRLEDYKDAVKHIRDTRLKVAISFP